MTVDLRPRGAIRDVSRFPDRHHFPPSRAAMTRVVVADDHPVFLGGLRQLLGEQADIDVLGTATDGFELLALLERTQPEVVVTDLSMPGRSGLDLVREIGEKYPHLRIVVLSMHSEKQYAVRAMKVGAHSYLSKENAGELLLKAVRQVASGRMFVTPAVGESLASGLGQPDTAEPHESLSRREYEVFLMLADGLGVSEIANKLFLSVKTVATHKSRIMEKMGFKNLAQLIRYALSHDLVDS